MFKILHVINLVCCLKNKLLHIDNITFPNVDDFLQISREMYITFFTIVNTIIVLYSGPAI